MIETENQDEFSERVYEITSEIEALVDGVGYEGGIEYDTYHVEESEVDVEINIHGNWADLVGLTELIIQSDSWAMCEFVHTEDSNEVLLALTYYPTAEGVLSFQTTE